MWGWEAVTSRPYFSSSTGLGSVPKMSAGQAAPGNATRACCTLLPSIKASTTPASFCLHPLVSPQPLHAGALISTGVLSSWTAKKHSVPATLALFQLCSCLPLRFWLSNSDLCSVSLLIKLLWGLVQVRLALRNPWNKGLLTQVPNKF